MEWLENRFLNRVVHKALWAAVLPLCAVVGVVQAVGYGTTQTGGHTSQAPASGSSDLPAAWQGTALRPLALSEVELRFAKHFPGTVARMASADNRTLVLRTVNQPTRMLHPATDCYRGLGYRIINEQLEVQAPSQDRWRCFVAQRKGRSLRVCERIEDAQGHGFTDTSSWYWAAIAGQSHGPWKAITVATPL